MTSTEPSRGLAFDSAHVVADPKLVSFADTEHVSDVEWSISPSTESPAHSRSRRTRRSSVVATKMLCESSDEDECDPIKVHNPECTDGPPDECCDNNRTDLKNDCCDDPTSSTPIPDANDNASSNLLVPAATTATLVRKLSIGSKKTNRSSGNLKDGVSGASSNDLDASSLTRRMSSIALLHGKAKSMRAKTRKNHHHHIHPDEKGLDAEAVINQLHVAISHAAGHLGTGIKKLFQTFDQDGNGFLDFTEFTALVVEMDVDADHDILLSVFEKFDRDGSGVLSYPAWCEGLNLNQSEALKILHLTEAEVLKEATRKDAEMTKAHDTYVQREGDLRLQLKLASRELELLRSDAADPTYEELPIQVRMDALMRMEHLTSLTTQTEAELMKIDVDWNEAKEKYKMDDYEERILRGHRALKEAKKHSHAKSKKMDKKVMARSEGNNNDEVKRIRQKERDMLKQLKKRDTFVTEYRHRSKENKAEFDELKELVFGPEGPPPELTSQELMAKKMRLLDLSDEMAKDDADFEAAETEYFENAIILTKDEERVLRGIYALRKSKGKGGQPVYTMPVREQQLPALPQVAPKKAPEPIHSPKAAASFDNKSQDVVSDKLDGDSRRGSANSLHDHESVCADAECVENDDDNETLPTGPSWDESVPTVESNSPAAGLTLSGFSMTSIPDGSGTFPPQLQLSQPSDDQLPTGPFTRVTSDSSMKENTTTSSVLNDSLRRAPLPSVPPSAASSRRSSVDQRRFSTNLIEPMTPEPPSPSPYVNDSSCDSGCEAVEISRDLSMGSEVITVVTALAALAPDSSIPSSVPTLPTLTSSSSTSTSASLPTATATTTIVTTGSAVGSTEPPFLCRPGSAKSRSSSPNVTIPRPGSAIRSASRSPSYPSSPAGTKRSEFTSSPSFTAGSPKLPTDGNLSSSSEAGGAVHHTLSFLGLPSKKNPIPLVAQLAAELEDARNRAAGSLRPNSLTPLGQALRGSVSPRATSTGGVSVGNTRVTATMLFPGSISFPPPVSLAPSTTGTLRSNRPKSALSVNATDTSAAMQQSSPSSPDTVPVSKLTQASHAVLLQRLWEGRHDTIPKVPVHPSTALR